MPAHPDPDPGAISGLRHLGRNPLLDVGLFPGDGIGTLLAAGMLETAAALLSGEPAPSEPAGPDPLYDPLSGDDQLT